MPKLQASIDPCLRAQHETFEHAYLASRATKASESLGRDVSEAECPIRTCFQRDRDRIVHAKSFRRLKHKTQVFIAPEGDHYRTRLTHTLEVSQISRTIARALRLNEDLTEAIAMGHDLGHTPFGHAGEQVLDALREPGFHHNEQSVRVVETLEPMNLTREVRDGILHHTGPGTAFTLEGQIVKIADRVAYLNHDIDDALRAGILDEVDLPGWVPGTFGPSKGARIACMVRDLIETSADHEHIRMSEGLHDPFLELRAFMFKRVYMGSKAKHEEGKARGIVEHLYRYYVKHPAELERELGRSLVASEHEQATVDYIAGMTDRYAIQTFERLFLPRPWRLGDEEARRG